MAQPRTEIATAAAGTGLNSSSSPTTMCIPMASKPIMAGPCYWWEKKPTMCAVTPRATICLSLAQSKKSLLTPSATHRLSFGPSARGADSAISRTLSTGEALLVQIGELSPGLIGPSKRCGPTGTCQSSKPKGKPVAAIYAQRRVGIKAPGRATLRLWDELLSTGSDCGARRRHAHGPSARWHRRTSRAIPRLSIPLRQYPRPRAY